MNAIKLPVFTNCWNQIGVAGDSSCPELKKHIHCRNCPVYSQAGQILYDRQPPEGYMAEWTARIAAADPPPASNTIAVILFRVGSEWLALDVSHTVEVSPMRPICRVPHQTDRTITGLVNIRGELQLAISLRELLKVHFNESNKTINELNQNRMLVVESDNVRWVFLVDEVEDIHHFRDEDLGPLPATVASGLNLLTSGVFHRKGKAIGYLDPTRLFPTLRRNFR